IWHFIGPLQSNKSRGVAEQFDWLHSMDRFKLAQRLNDQRPAEKAPLNLLIQVNISQDPAKSGVKPDQVAVLATQILALPRLEFRGLMAIPAADLPLATLTAQFQELKRLQQSLIKDFPECTELSIGMSGDFPTAIDCGATMVRIGTDIFGAR
ncbi:MAG: YggS family pyridoxal phosphate-dependent enzyme, partial [Reinekea forsetii]|nr:YggS family pyridoxal phosphate-dependent enzyme [Reinekea forsetii]